MNKYSEKLHNAVKESTIEISSIDELDSEWLNKTLKKYTFCIIKGLIDPETIRSSKLKIRAYHNPDNERPATGEHPDELMNNFQKLSIGGAEHSGVYRPRCMRTFYNPIWSEDIFGLKNSFKVTAQVRNILYGFDRDYAIDEVGNDFWTASRIHNYPSGGGFLVSHRDNIVPTVQKKSKLSNQYFQPVILMSKKGSDKNCDFATGGGFIEVFGERFFYEEVCELGDIIIYSGETIHGVADIDLEKVFDTRKADGRFAGFVTLYKKFNKKKELNDFVEPPKDKLVVY